MKTLPNNFYTMPEWASTTMEESDLKEVMLATGGEILACGQLWNVCTNHLGAGVYKVFLKRWTIDHYGKDK